MTFKVPKFLERETKFFAFLTFRQLAVVGIVGIILFVFYYLVPKKIFFPVLLIGGGGVLALLFVRVEGIALYQLFYQFFGFFISSKKYLWKKREILSPIKLLKKEKEVKKEEKEEARLKVSPESRLRKLSSKIERGLR